MEPNRTSVVVFGEGITMLDIICWMKKRGINIPSKGKRKIPGYFLNLCLFENRTHAGLIALIAFIGGALPPELVSIRMHKIFR